ncbi:MAG: YbaK/prolyl-tRNA synthetase associated region [Parcubacteria group bacterium LiPW_39]|nr:MAG: YbaK/prolyl-tRNA synthetase associated region [Parcubacteria group bacterium LiPW_39]
MLSKTLKNFLEKNKIKYEVIEHRTVYTALDKAATLHIKPAQVGKTVLVSFDGKDYAIGLIPANKNLDKKKLLAVFNKVRQKSGRKNYKKTDFATEKWMKAHIKGSKLGATPPFGILYKLPFFIDNSLVKQPKIIVNAGEYELSLKLSPTALIKLDPNTIKGSFSMAKK